MSSPLSQQMTLSLRISLAGSHFHLNEKKFQTKQDLIQYLESSCPFIRKHVVFRSKLDFDCDFVVYSGYKNQGPPKTYIRHGIPALELHDFLEQFHQTCALLRGKKKLKEQKNRKKI
jgi:hypothetical protein